MCVNTWPAYRLLGLTVGVWLVVASWARSQQGWPNEVYYARCIPQQSCSGDCVIMWEPWQTAVPPNQNPPKPTCPSGTACVAFEGFWGSGSRFKACVASTVSTDKCNTGDVQPPPPIVAVCWGEFYFCACRSLTTGECENNTAPPLLPAPFPCLCDIQIPDGTTTYLANNNCT